MTEAFIQQFVASAPGVAGTVFVCWMFLRHLDTTERDMTAALRELTAEIRKLK